MDARRDGVVFTPRHGKPVEINALWHNALLSFAQLTSDENERDTLREIAGQCALSMQMQFWWPHMNCCHDVLNPVDDPMSPGGRQFVGDSRMRPNQIFAASLPFTPLTKHQCADIVNVVGRRLLTPVGLRTLAADDAQYKARFEGDLFQRDAAYHNGTVWPWLIGPYCEALLRVNQFSDSSRRQARTLLQPLIDELDAPGEGCIGQIAEVYDGDEPRRPAGCIAQAWSIAELIRIICMVQANPTS
jgi:predicted glycogen debranching enzyme